jgi:membrane protein insertase Oxa1/YidC/SpoIIIJ
LAGKILASKVCASGAVALYWITSNLFMVAQQIYVKREKTFKTVIK